MFIIAVKRYVDTCWVYDCLVCYDNKVDHCCLGKGRYNIGCDARCNAVMVGGGCDLKCAVGIRKV